MLERSSYVTVIDVRTFGIEGDRYEDHQQQTSVCEQICSSAGVVEVCTTNRPTLIQPFICTCGCYSLSILEI